MLVLNPKDSTATHQLGLALMQLGRCKEALAVFGKISDLNPGEEEYADTVFRMGQCYVELEQWEDAYVHFHTLYETAVEFEETNKNVALPSGTRVLSKEKLVKWLDKVRPHIPETDRLQAESPARPKALPVEEISPEMLDRLKPQNALGTSVSLMGRDADFSWFRYVIPANRVMRDDFPTGAHEFLPLESGDTFQTTQPDIYLVFRLVSDSYDAVPLAAQCFLEVQELAGDHRPIVQDRVLMAMSDQSGFFKLIPPGSRWKPGLYRCGLFAGERATADTLVDEVRFRVIETSG
jgi:tetratricopeptide (TPR) repeat protein